MELDTEFWFGVEICVYVIFPLLLLTVFGTVNCCKVSLSSRMLPTKQVQAIKINIAVTVSTNIALFLFLVQVGTHIITLVRDFINDLSSGISESLAETVAGAPR